MKKIILILSTLIYTQDVTLSFGTIDATFNDLNGNGQWDDSENFEDLNGNGVYDEGELYEDSNFNVEQNIPNDILFHLDSFYNVGVSSPIKTNNGYALIYFYSHQKKMVPNIKNSWDLIYNYAKQKKQNTIFQNLVNNIKNDTYIKIIN